MEKRNSSSSAHRNHNNYYDSTYDYVIVGGGASAMGLLHGWLSTRSSSSNDDNVSIAVLERGGDSSSSSVVSDWARQSYISYVNSQDTIPVGQGYGGSTNINAGWIELPSSDDFVSWPLFFSQQMYEKAVSLQTYIRHQQQHVTTLRSLMTGKATRSNPSIIWKPTIHLAATSYSQKHRRVNFYQLLVEPLLCQATKAKNITFYQNALVERLLFDSQTCMGVECTITTTCKSSLRIRARKKVILCSGAIYTPALLLISLPKTYIHYNQIGKHWKDHFTIPRALYFHWPSLSRFKKRNAINSIQSFSTPITAKNGVRYSFCIMDGYCSIYTYPVILHNYLQRITFGCELLVTVFYWISVFLLQYTPLRWFIQYCTASLLIFIFNPSSTGSITTSPKQQQSQNKKRLPSNDNQESKNKLSQFDIKCQPCPYHLTCKKDLERVQVAYSQWTDNNNSISNEWGFYELFPTSLLNAFYQCHLMPKMILPFFHFTGTCAMPTTTDDDKLPSVAAEQKNKTSVVNGKLYVRTIRNLQICDASVIPTQISAPTALTCATLGYLATPLIFHHHNNDEDATISTTSETSNTTIDYKKKTM